MYSLFYAAELSGIGLKTFAAAKVHKKNDIRKRECHFYGFWVGSQRFWQELSSGAQ